MLISALIKHYKLIVLLLLPISIQAEENNPIIIGFNESIINKIDDLFLTQPTKQTILWVPKIKGKSKYAFSIPKNAYLNSKNHGDLSDLFYLSEKIDSGLKLQKNNSKNIYIIISENNSNLIFSQSILSNTNAELFFKNKEEISYGINLNKDVIISKNSFGNFSIEQTNDENTVFNVKFVKLSKNENSELYGNINYKYKSDYVNVGLGNTWFDILNQFDFTIGLQEQDNKFKSELYASFGHQNIKFQLGFDKINSTSKLNLFFNLRFENKIENRLGTNIFLSSRDNISGLRDLSLKIFRKKNLDVLWKKNMNYN